jgi:hypothetical protein
MVNPEGFDGPCLDCSRTAGEGPRVKGPLETLSLTALNAMSVREISSEFFADKIQWRSVDKAHKNLGVL